MSRNNLLSVRKHGRPLFWTQLIQTFVLNPFRSLRPVLKATVGLEVVFVFRVARLVSAVLL